MLKTLKTRTRIKRPKTLQAGELRNPPVLRYHEHLYPCFITRSGVAIPLITPAAFISLVCFALLAAVIIQGPLGLSSAFAGEETSLQPTARSSDTGSKLLSTFKLLEVLGMGGSQRETTAPSDNGSKLGGQHNVVGPGGASSSNWFISPGRSSRRSPHGTRLIASIRF